MEPSDPHISESTFACTHCGYNLTGTAIGGQCPECGAPIDQSLLAYRARSGGSVLPKLGYTWPVLITIFCCVIGGVISIVYTAKGNTAAAIGAIDEYKSCKKNRDGWLIASIIIGLVATALQVGLVVAGGM